MEDWAATAPTYGQDAATTRESGMTKAQAVCALLALTWALW